MSDSALDAAGSSLPLSPPRTAAAARTHSDARAASAGKEHVIDAMRGFAALLVAYFHCRQVAWVGMQAFHQSVGHSLSVGAIAAYLTFPIAWGSAGVPIFFVISGYCIHRGGALRLAGTLHVSDEPGDWRYQLRGARRVGITRRAMLVAAASAAAVAPMPLAAQPITGVTVDLHSHAGKLLYVRSNEAFTSVAEPMRKGGMAVICLAIVTDSPTTRIEGVRIKAFRNPSPGELY